MQTTAHMTAPKLTARMIALLALLLLSSVGMFGQNVKVTPAANLVIENTIAADDNGVAATATATTAATETLNMVSWFMGTKQTTNGTATDFSENSKKQLIHAGVQPNRLLIKAFLKKASNYNSTVA